MSYDSHYSFRSDLVDALYRDLVGPLPTDPQDEIISDPPITRYVAGILYPQEAEAIDPAHDLGDVQDEDDEGTYADPPVAMANIRYPSSMGLTFGIDTAQTSEVSVAVRTAKYEPLDAEGAPTRWQRIPLDYKPIPIRVQKPNPLGHADIDENLQVVFRVRAADANGIAAVTVVLVNNKIRPERGHRDGSAFFQSRIEVTAKPGEAPFVARPKRTETGPDEDVNSNRLLYRHRAAIAVGHGCSVEWTPDSADSHRAGRVITAILPTYELLLSDSNPDIPTDSLSMERLSGSNRDFALAGLDTMINSYDRWIDTLVAQITSLNAGLRAAAERHIAGCREASQRMRAGLVQLRSNADVWDAFRLANRAMLQQRARTVWLKQDVKQGVPVESDQHRWRPFQIAFIVLCIEGISDHRSPSRQIADLLWFPTGGGKTEAYLGLIAFTMFLRRLRAERDVDGVTVIMRYTLRLLTIQQFERATLLICCCEQIRRLERRLGTTPFSIGLWVGRGGTPNSLAEARIALDKLRRGRGVSLEECNPVQLQSCPWCGTPLTPNHYYIADHDPRLVITCKTAGCEFQKGLPVYVVDDDIYRKRPSLLVATADKFASLPWRESVINIFNAGTPVAPPPELIIQDELHLISGPLGTLAGLYETAIDLLCSRDGIRPKVIASTATIRRAQHQGKGLFEREVRQFPPPGLDARNSFFAVEANRKDRATRLYVGIMAPGVSQTTLLVRCYAALLQNVSTLSAPDSVKDNYWTLVGYFNSLRVLGGARMQVQDDVGERITLLARSTGTSPRTIDQRIELTSREPSGDIPAHLKRMAKSFPHPDAIDVILATNMISVGVDVDRLGLMAVMGQPQATSEYIQATSRVGRRDPGLVCTLFNAARSRDRSHYESFVDYHSALYRQVESTSVTPFSARARDRALHAILIALVRLTIPELRDNGSAADIAQHLDKLAPVRQAILRRVQEIEPTEMTSTALQLEQIVRQWVEKAANQKDLVYVDFSHPDLALLGNIGSPNDASDDSFPTLWSLRDVDSASNLYLVR